MPRVLTRTVFAPESTISGGNNRPFLLQFQFVAIRGGAPTLFESLPLAARPRRRSSRYCRNGRKNARMSSTSAAGCSIAAKWPPRGMTVQLRMSV